MNTRSLIPLAIALLALAVSAGLYGFGYYTLVQSQEKAASLATLIDTKTSALNRLSQAHAALATLSNDEATLNLYSIGKEDVVSFLGTLQAEGKPLGTSIGVLSVSDDTSGGHSRLSLSLTITGSFDGVMRTLGAIEYGPYDSVLTNLTLDTAPAPGGKGAPVWTAAGIYSVGVRQASSTPTKP